jgi:hypothetical protein
MKEQLSYLGYSIGECTKENGCECDYCKSCTFALELVARMLEIAIQNDSHQHFNLLAVNLDYLFRAAREVLEGQQERTVH